ncbi:rnd transporter : Cation/multidrug efflux pump OS=Singulisphaera acidiphila (strain ATCC BAA-1392 / DSM 18658 / VKM B-2454 / MOB10) GN=Sinac_7474 PE=4 SV=1: ACR_tran: ACR_tran [Gemmata massiliana]|uniref:SSD domain-containing protein n=1 Tax=Gemmata massiliana TaxID=1210884 RepID=A0A6P2CZC1_9BACT|nr:efflux RND transporter permease subunit [Gemmata massiliana]VTR94203.1 rnd transporter : Cation/multidrug efflux pump OS=Singulisphaera acidiphila (strain ATCC BAA-1392 / DSM 18658 / VKM B-2454 / MOB10) GN=Sinac_7474 PE=4 SV=1: ACR_tran: ACR_tran [Gemmata massiliana]
MFSRFFIDRPIFASVLSIVITLAGVLALLNLPVAQYPEISPPSISVSISYPGASAQVVADTVAAPIEQQVNGVEGMLYMSSQSGNDGSYSLSVTFEIGTDLNTALVMVQNRVMLAMPQLPSEVQLQGITIRKKTPDILQVISFYSPDDRYDIIYMSNFATVNVRDELLRIDGVSDINVFGQRDYSMRAWLNPQKLAARGLTATDVAASVRAQNKEAAPGQIGLPPTLGGRAFQLTLDTRGRLVAEDEFGDIIIKAGRASRPQALVASASTGSGARSAGTLGGGFTGGAATNTGTLGDAPNLSAIFPTTTSATSSTNSSSTPATFSFPSYVTNSFPGSSATGSATLATGPATTGPALSMSSSAGASGATSSTDPTGTTTSDMTDNGSGMSANSPLGTAMPGMSSSAGATRTAPVTGGTVGTSALNGGSLDGGTTPSAAIVRLRDVARLELGSQSYTNGATFDGKPSVGLAIHLLPGANALDVAERVRMKMDELKGRFPDGIEYQIAYDTTPFIRESIQDVVQTLFEAIALVALVVLLFLQNWRAAVIPLVAVPVAIMGTFAVMLVLGFTVNNISLFGLVLAIGIVVDDAIVVVENVERWLEQGLEPREAAYKAMEEVTGPVVAIALVLCAVFVPCAFVGGITGQFYRQFAVTITASTVFSALNSLTLSPALAAILLKGKREKEKGKTLIGTVFSFLAIPFSFLLFPFSLIARLFNRGFEFGTRMYTAMVGWLLRLSLIVLVLYGGLLVATYWVFQKAPTGFVPDQDQGRLIVSIQLPDSASLERTQEIMARVDQLALNTPGVQHTASAAGMSLLMSANSSNFGTVFLILDPFEKRQRPDLTADAIMAKLRKDFAREIRDADVKIFGAAPVPGLSVASGFKVMVQDRGGIGLAELQKQTDAVVGKLQPNPATVGVLTQFRSKTPQLYLDVDRTKAQALGVPLNDVNQAMQIYLGSLYASSFNEFGRHWQVTLQAEGRYRTRIEDVNLLQVRNKWGEMVPLGTLVQLREINGPVSVTRYNLYTSAAVSGNVPPSVSSGEAINAVNAAAEQTLPRSMSIEWTELMYLQLRAGNTAIYVFALAVVFVFLALAALYESWALPLAVILVVPLCLLCSIGGVLIAHKAVDVFVQIGLVVLVGLACKNAILIVEFAEVLHREGKPRREAALEASRLRIRPILMTSLAFILGVLPLVVASGAGAEMRRSLGIAVFSGMLGVTLFGVFLTPVFFDLIQRGVDSKVFSETLSRGLGAGVLGALLGYTVAHVLVGLELARSPWAEIAGGVSGAVLANVIPPAWRWIKGHVKWER